MYNHFNHNKKEKYEKSRYDAGIYHRSFNAHEPDQGKDQCIHVQ